MSAIQYFETVQRITETIKNTQMERIQRVAKKIADSIQGGGVLHIFGSGHSHMIGEDVFFRAGGLACINVMLESSLMEVNVGRTTLLERLPGYANVLLEGYDLRAGEVIVIVSNSGINAVPVEMALECKRRGLHVVAITSKTHSSATHSRHAQGVKLMDVADVVLDNGGEAGDATLEEESTGIRYGPSSTLCGILIMQMIVAEVVSQCTKAGFKPPMFISANQHGGDESNQQLVETYQSRVRYFPK